MTTTRYKIVTLPTRDTAAQMLYELTAAHPRVQFDVMPNYEIMARHPKLDESNVYKLRMTACNVFAAWWAATVKTEADGHEYQPGEIRRSVPVAGDVQELETMDPLTMQRQPGVRIKNGYATTGSGPTWKLDESGGVPVWRRWVNAGAPAKLRRVA